MTQRVQEIMSANPVTVDGSSSVQQAAVLMKERGIGDVLVRRDGELCGLVTDRDVVVRGLAQGLDLSSTPVDEICSHELVQVTPTDTVDDAVKLMREHSIRRLAVIENGEPVGVVSIGDIAVDRAEGSLLGDISAAADNR